MAFSVKDAQDFQAALNAELFARMQPIAAATGKVITPGPTAEQYRQMAIPTERTKQRSIEKNTKGTNPATDKLEGSDLVREQIATETAKLAGAGKVGASGRHWWDDWASNLINYGGHAIDYTSRVGKAATSAVYALEHPEEAPSGGELLSSLGQAAVGGLTGQDQYAHTGAEVIGTNPVVSGMSGGWQKSALTTGLGLTLDIGLDPVTYVSGGTTTLGKGAAKSALAKLAEKELLAPGVLGAAETAIGLTEKGGTVAKGVKSASAAEIKTQVTRAALKKAEGKGIRSKIEAQVSKESKALKKSVGHEMPPEMRATRVAELSLQKTETFQRQLTTALEAANKRRVAFKILGKDLLSGKVGSKIGRGIYKPFEVAGVGANKLPVVRGLREAFQVGNHFPGQTNRIRRLAESQGIRQHEILSKEIDTVVKDLSKRTRRQIYLDLEKGIRTEGVEGGKDLGKVYDYFKEQFRGSFNKLEEAGIYKPTDQAENYAPQFYRRGATKDIAEMKNLRKSGIRNPGTMNPSDYGIQVAKDKGLHPYDLIDDAAKLHDADVTRRLVRRDHGIGIVNEYGVRAKNEAADAMRKMGLVPADDLMAPADREILKGLKESMWIHPEIKNTTKALDDMLKAGNHDELNRLMRLADRVTNWWKRTATVYNPGNWINNSLGDITMNWLDGVQNPMDYVRAFRLLKGEVKGMMKVGPVKLDSTLVKHLYDMFGSGAGYLRAEVGTDIASKLSHAIGRGFEKREDFGRMAHFINALGSELKTVKDINSLNKLLAHNPSLMELRSTAFGRKLVEKATAAGDRVAKWNIDYSAFTPFERKLKKVIPFYAWQRKSIPLLFEAMATKPGRVSAIKKTQDAISQMMGGDPNAGDYNVAYPFWLRQGGFMRMSGGKEPWTLPDPTPLAMWGKTFGAQNPSDFLLDRVASLNPMAKIPLELAFKKQAFSGQKLPEDMKQYWMSQLPMMNTASYMSGTDVRGNDLTTAQQLSGLLGSKIYHVTDKAQAGELQRQKDPLDARLSAVNKKLKESPQHVVIRKVKGGYKVVNDNTEETFGVMDTPASAMALAVQVAGLNK